jgi:hypothetical protein
MPAKKIRVDVFDGSGNRYTVTFDGQVTREKAVRLLDIVELLGGMPAATRSESPHSSELSKLEKVRLIVEKHFPIIWFSAKDVQNVYEQEMKEPVPLSIISTYLTRMAQRGMLTKTGMSNTKHYRLATPNTEITPSHTKDNK